MILAALYPATGFTHGGGLNSEGCHHNRKTGDYHCHRSTAAPARTPAASFSGNNLTERAPATSARAYRNCTEARAAGAAPVRRGENGYGAHLDRDGDGVGCE